MRALAEESLVEGKKSKDGKIQKLSLLLKGFLSDLQVVQIKVISHFNWKSRPQRLKEV